MAGHYSHYQDSQSAGPADNPSAFLKLGEDEPQGLAVPERFKIPEVRGYKTGNRSTMASAG